MERSPKRVHAGGDDRISGLPDELRLRILSFLDTKSAVETSVLSKRWTRLWAFSPCLRFDQYEFPCPIRADHEPPYPATARFVSFVDRALALRARSVSISRFQLQWHCDFDITKATTWLHYAMSHGVREVVLWMPTSPGERLALPGALFCCQSLEHLVLEASEVTTAGIFFCPAILPAPSSVSFSKLKQLWIVNIVTSAAFVEEVLSRCPDLEELTIGVSGNYSILRASAPNLKRLRLVLYLSNRQDSRIQISAPRLRRFMCYFWNRVPEIELGNPLLREAELGCSMIQDVNGANLAHILATIRNAEVLFLKEAIILSLSMVPDLPKHMSLSFPRLKHLEITVLLNEVNIRSIIFLLKSSTYLEALVIHNSKKCGPRWNVDGLEVDWLAQELDSESTLHHLKKININGFLGVKDELGFVTVLLKHAGTLRNMILKYDRESLSPEIWMEIFQDLLSIPRASSTAKILLSTMASFNED